MKQQTNPVVETTAEYDTDGALLKKPDNVVIMPIANRMRFIDNIVTTAINNMVLTYGEDAVFEALSFHYKLKQN